MGKMSSLKSLQRLIGFSNQEAADYCFVTLRTYRRWCTDQSPNPMAVRLLSVRAGYLPWDGWDQWEMHNGVLFPPGYARHGITPGQVMAIPFDRQLITEYRRLIDQARDEQPKSGEIHHLRMPG